jgi:hypothetical protein
VNEVPTCCTRKLYYGVAKKAFCTDRYEAPLKYMSRKGNQYGAPAMDGLKKDDQAWAPTVTVAAGGQWRPWRVLRGRSRWLRRREDRLENVGTRWLCRLRRQRGR